VQRLRGPSGARGRGNRGKLGSLGRRAATEERGVLSERGCRLSRRRSDVEFFKGYSDLEMHFRDEHLLCRDPQVFKDRHTHTHTHTHTPVILS
jgi:hypothetical protein